MTKKVFKFVKFLVSDIKSIQKDNRWCIIKEIYLFVRTYLICNVYQLPLGDFLIVLQTQLLYIYIKKSILILLNKKKKIFNSISHYFLIFIFLIFKTMIKSFTIILFFVLLVSTTCVEVEGRENEQQSLVVSRLQHGRALDVIVHRTILNHLSFALDH